MTTRANQQFVARAHARQLQVSRRADAATLAVDRVVLRLWRVLLGILRAGPHWSEGQHAASLLFARLAPLLREELAHSLRRLSLWGWRSAVAGVRASVPKRTLAKAAASISAPNSAGRLVEDDRDPLAIFRDLFAPFRDFLPGTEPEPDTLAQISALLFPTPTPADIAAVVYDTDWEARLGAATRLAPPAQLAGLVSAGLARGLSHQEIARELMPAVNRVRASARRVARTEALRVAGAMQMQCHEQLGDLVIGYRLLATKDEHSRPWHLKRDGTVYYKEPRSGQKGPEQMPHPPDEPRDPAERPPGTPATAWNCRCCLIPVLRD